MHLRHLIVTVMLLMCVNSIHPAMTISASINRPRRFQTIDETVVYKALTVVEGDILVDKYCQCENERSCLIQGRNIIELSK